MSLAKNQIKQLVSREPAYLPCHWTSSCEGISLASQICSPRSLSRSLSLSSVCLEEGFGVKLQKKACRLGDHRPCQIEMIFGKCPGFSLSLLLLHWLIKHCLRLNTMRGCNALHCNAPTGTIPQWIGQEMGRKNQMWISFLERSLSPFLNRFIKTSQVHLSFGWPNTKTTQFCH